VDYRISAEERASFKRCRRQWDFASPHRRNLEPIKASGQGLPRALRDALAVYYYPGMWDWPHELTQPLVHKAFERSLEEAGETAELARGASLLDCYHAWAQTVDDFAPVKINYDLLVLVPDPGDPSRGLTTADGSPVKYECQVDLLAADTRDEYWVVCNRPVENWQDVAALIGDEEAVAACWAWEEEFMGMTIAGTVHNEVRVGGPLTLPRERATRTVAQNEPSGGGRSIPQHERVQARDARAVAESRVQQRTAGVLRRTRIRRSRDEIAGAPRLIAAEALEMAGEPAIGPTFAAHCATCEFTAPCLTMLAGNDAEPLLAHSFRTRIGGTKPRLGQSTWGFGRGAAPPNW
jgi:hypothetical protein